MIRAWRKIPGDGRTRQSYCLETEHSRGLPQLTIARVNVGDQISYELWTAGRLGRRINAIQVPADDVGARAAAIAELQAQADTLTEAP